MRAPRLNILAFPHDVFTFLRTPLFTVPWFPDGTFRCRLPSRSVFGNSNDIATESLGNLSTNPVYLFDWGFTWFLYHLQAALLEYKW